MGDLDAFRERLRMAMKARGWSQAELARRADVRDATVSDWFNRNTAPKAELMLRLPQVLGVDGHWLLTGEGEDVRDVRKAPDHMKAENLMEHYEGLVRQMGGAGVDPDELMLRKMDLADGLIRLHAAAGSIPGWVYQLKARIQRGDL